MDILDENFGATTAPVDLHELVATPLAPLTLPTSSIRNRAATTALLSSDPATAVDNYQLLAKEGADGQSQIQKQIQDSIIKTTTEQDIGGVMRIMGDASVPLETKRQVIRSFKDSQFLKDSGTVLHSNALAAGSKGENQEQEDVRLSSADAIREIYTARNEIQGLVNAHGASLKSTSVGTVGEMAEVWMMPFGNSINTAKVSAGIEPQSMWATIKDFLLPGTTIAQKRAKLANLPPEKRVEFAKTIIDSISNNSGIIFSNDNQFAQFDKASNIFEAGGYSGLQEFLDNVSPLLDALGVGAVARGAIKGSRAAKAADKAAVAGERVFPAEWELVNEIPKTGTEVSTRVRVRPELIDVPDQIKRIELNSVVRQENPSSPANILQSANPEKARTVHETVVKSGGDEVAEGLYGVTKDQAIINDVMPQVSTGSGRVTAKVVDIDRNLRQELHVSDEMVELINNTGASYYTPAEKAQARASVVNNFQNASGLTPNDAMSTFAIDGGRIKVDAVYGTTEGGFLRPEDALGQARFAMGLKGVDEKNLTLLKRQGLDYVPVNLQDVRGVDGDYMVRVSTYQDFDHTDMSALQTFDVKRNFFDRVGPTVSQNTGSVSRYLFDAASMLHSTYTGAASVASDATAKFEKFMLQQATNYSDLFKKLPEDRKFLVNDYIREANFKEIKFDQADLVARGFNTPEIDSVKAWRDFWDSHFYLENADIVKTLNSQGFQRFKNTNTELYVKPISKDSTVGRVYDPSTDSVVQLTKVETDALYDAGGTLAKLRRPTDFSGTTAEHMIVRNTPSEYIRKFKDSDQVLNYRDGYYQLQYKAPRFVDEIIKDQTGKVTGTRTVAVAGDMNEAKFFADRMAASEGKEYKVRGDSRALRRDGDEWWDLNSASGRIAQRHRGKRLEDAAGVNHLGDGSYVLNPVDSAVRAAKSISARTVNRPMIEAAKARFINQYGDVLPPNGMGGRKWPNSVKDISSKGDETSSLVADARTTYEYINYLENGYLNTVDDVFKTGLNAMANMLGNAGYGKLERGAMSMSDAAPTSLAKNGVFMAYIGSNVLRQWIIQPHQILRTWAYNPIGWANGQVEKYASGYLMGKMGLPISSDLSKFTKFMDDSGMLDAVDKQNLVRGTLTAAAETGSNIPMKVGKGIMNTTRKIGFDMGENANLIGHSSAVYERYLRLGRNLEDKAVRDAAYSEIRAISYDMNFAGDMVYNQTTPAMVLQFMQVPHKAILQATNRRIDPAVRLRMVAADLIMWGAPTGLIAATIGKDILPDDDYWRETFQYGIESALLNQMFTKVSGEKTNIDFSSLAPYDMTGWTKFFEAMYSGGFSQILANSPAGQLFLKDGGRTRNAIANMSRYFGNFVDPDEDAPTFLQVMNEVAKISSGYNSAIKAKILLDARKRYDQYGSNIDQEVSTPEAWAQSFGFGTADTRDLYKMTMDMAKDVKTHREETLKVYEGIKRYYTEKLEVENSDPVFITKVTGRIMKVFEDDPVAQALIANQLKTDLAGKDAALLALFMKRSAIPSLGDLKDKVRQMPVSDEQKALMMQRIDDVQNIREDIKKDK